MSATVMTLPSYMAGFLYEIGPPGGGVYSYVSYPSAVLPNRPKYRNEQNNNNNGPVNIMHDKRVVRGNTYAINQKVPPMRFNVTSTADDALRQKQAERRSYVRKRVLPTIGAGLAAESRNRPRIELAGLTNSAGGSSTGKSSSDNGYASTDARFAAARTRVRKRLAQFQNGNGSRPGGPAHPPPNRRPAAAANRATGERAPVQGRQHRDMQTERWLEEIKDRAPETEVGVQTEEALWPTAPPETTVSEPGSAAATSRGLPNGGGPREAFQTPPPDTTDKSTQIEAADPDLFVFDDEVVIVLEALVHKTLEHSLLEVIDEEERAVDAKEAEKDSKVR